MIHLHVHTDHTGFDGFGKPAAFIAVALKQGAKAIAFTEHGTLRGIHDFDSAAKRAGIRPIFGVELYLTSDMTWRGFSKEERKRLTEGVPYSRRRELLRAEEERRGLRKQHLTLLAMNETGLRNLYRLTSIAWLDGFHWRPAVDLPTFWRYSDGLIVLSGCMIGPVASAVIREEPAEAVRIAEEFQARLGDRFYLEIMPHDLDELRLSNEALLEIGEALGIPAVATQDAHYPRSGDWRYQEALLCIHTRGVLLSPSRFRFSTREYHLRSQSEMLRAFDTQHPRLDRRAVTDAVARTHEVAARCELAALPTSPPLVPSIELPAGMTGADYLWTLCKRGLEERGLDGADYRERLEREIRTIEERGVVDYFLAVAELYQWAWINGITTGPGRGSVGGSLVAYLLRITQIDPIRHGLMFERFLAPGRKDLPDIDCDFASDQRDRVLAYLRDRYGEDHVARISTQTTLRGRACIRDVGRVYQIPVEEIEKLIPAIPDKYITQEAQDAGGLADPFRNDPVCREFAERYPPVVATALKLEGTAKSQGVHPAGIVIAPVPIVEVCPLETRESGKERIPVTALDMKGVEALGLVKLDILGLHNLKVIRDALHAIGRTGKREPDLNRIPLDDRKVLAGFTKRHLVGIFQLDTPLADRLCEGIRFERFEDVAILNALGRPGISHSGLAEEYRRRKRDPKARKGLHPVVDAICADSLGVIIYQEHLIRILLELGGYTPERADKVRKMVGKKHGKHHVEAELEDFVQEAIRRGIPRRKVEDLASAMMHMGAYAFNKCVDAEQGVATVEGTRAAGALRPGDRVYVCDSEGPRAAPVRAVYDHGLMEAVEVWFDDGAEVVCTWNHRFLTDQGVLSLIDAIRSGARFAQARMAGAAGGLEGDLLRHRVQNPSGEVGAFADVPTVPRGAVAHPVRNDAPRLGALSGSAARQSVCDCQEDLGACRHSGTPCGGSSGLAKSQPREGGGDSCCGAGEESSTQVRFAAGGTDRHSRSSGEEERAGSVREGAAAGGFRSADALDRSGRTAPLPAPVRLGAARRDGAAGRVAEHGSGAARDCAAADRARLLHNGGAHSRMVRLSHPERDPASRSGAYLYRRPLWIRRLGARAMVDIEVDAPHLFALSNGIVSHNSHATAYGLIAYREMYLKTYHPAEFVWALLTHASKDEDVARYVEEARRLGIRVSPPNVNAAWRTWGVDGDAVIPALIMIKGVGPAAVAAIEARAPYRDFVDFAERVDRRRCHRGVALALLKAGALFALVPNERWLHENFDKVWACVGRRGWQSEVASALLASTRAPDWSTEEAGERAREVCPVRFDRVRH